MIEERREIISTRKVCRIVTRLKEVLGFEIIFFSIGSVRCLDAFLGT
jgi:hypothetical protein